MGASATLQERTVAAEPGSEAVVHVRVQNTGQVVDQFAMQVLGAAASWATVEPPVLSLFPGRDEVATVTFRPPRDSAVPAGELPFGVRVVSHEDPQGVVVEEGTLTVGAFRETTVELVPRNSSGSRSASHDLAIDNRGNVPVQVSVHGNDPDGALSFGFRPAAQTIAPGRAGFTRVRVRARQVFLSGAPRPHPFQLQVVPDGEGPIGADGSMVQGPLVSRIVRMVAVGAALAVVAGALLWFFAIKPGVQSAARDAVAAPMASQAAAIAQLQRNQAQPGGGGGAGASPTPAVAPPAGAGPASTAGAGFARRLDQSGGGRNQYRVPAGTTLAITDVVFQNPGGDHGMVQLQREGTTLLVENLDNFRDFDLHVVTPIVVSGGQTIQLSVQCSPGCPSAAIFINGVQRPS
ncbi:MAG TPA: hypothetical protein VGO86_10570 [Candidatus Dormibacteraeota bacterium]